MLLDIVKKGSTDRSVTLRIIDSADGTPETGVVFNSSGIDLWYRREGAAVVSITEATLAALTTAHTDGGFLHVSHGEYRLDLPDAAFATGANYVDIGGTVTGMIVIGGRVRLVDWDAEDSVRGGLTALPNVASGNAGALVTAGTGTAQISVASGLVTLAAVTHTGATIPTVTTTATATNVTTVNGLAANAITAASIASDAITAAKIADGAIDAATFAADVDAEILSYLVDDATRIDASALNTASGTSVPAIKAKTDQLSFNGSGHVAAAAGASSFVHTSGKLWVLDGDGNPIAPASGVLSAAAIADAVWDEVLGGHLTAGTTGAGLNAAGSAGDPWATSLPGAYGAGTAGKIVGDSLDAAVSSRMATYTQPPGFLATTFGASVGTSTYAGADTSGTTTLLARVPGTVPTLAQILAGGDIDGYTLEETLKLCLAALAGKVSGAATTTITIRAADDSASRIVATVDSDGNRSAVTLNAAG